MYTMSGVVEPIMGIPFVYAPFVYWSMGRSRV